MLEIYGVYKVGFLTNSGFLKHSAKYFRSGKDDILPRLKREYFRYRALFKLKEITSHKVICIKIF